MIVVCEMATGNAFIYYKPRPGQQRDISQREAIPKDAANGRRWGIRFAAVAPIIWVEARAVLPKQCYWWWLWWW